MQLHSATSGHSAPVRKRYPVLDCLRGILLLNMIAYHFLYDWVYIFGQNCTFMHTRYAFIWQQIICSGFILLAGCCSTLSRHAAKHGIRIFLCGMLITLVTTTAAPNEQILFGILHFTGLAYLITALLKPWLAKIPTPVFFAAALSLFAFTRGIYYGYLGIFLYELFSLPDFLYQYPGLFLIGLPSPDFASADYFPLIPWLFLFWTGCSIAPALFKSRSFDLIQHWHLPGLNWIGRHTLVLYMLHQPLVFGVLWLIFS